MERGSGSCLAQVKLTHDHGTASSSKWRPIMCINGSDQIRTRTAPSSSSTVYVFSAVVAGPLITAPEEISNREPWHWHIIALSVSRPAESGHAWSLQVQRSS